MTDSPNQAEAPSRSAGRTDLEFGRRFWLRLVLLAALDSLVVYAVIVLGSEGAWPLLVALLIGATFVNWVYLWPRTNALRWTTPGVLLMVVFVALPILYTLYISFTNWSTGHLLNKGQVIEILESRSYVDPDAAGELFELFAYRDDGEIRFLLIGEDGRMLFGEPRLRTEEPLVDATQDPEELGMVDADGDGIPDGIGPYRLLSRPELFGLANQLDFTRLVIDIEDGEVQILGLSEARVVLASRRYLYDVERDVMVDLVEQKECLPGETIERAGSFVCSDGESLIPGWVSVVGSDNYSNILTNENIRGPFLGVLLWNVVFAFLSVVLTFALGLLLAIALQHERFRGRLVWRSIYILPYAVPPLLMILLWQGLLNTQFGPVNDMLGTLGIDPIPWLNDASWAKVAVLLVNTWLGFPYMFLICTGALQAIPAELQEAARVDGAGGFGVFRRITFPLLMVSLAPLLIGSFAFNFNNFGLIFLLTNGGPPILDAAVPVGSTDILITFIFDLAFAGGRGNQFGLAAAITVFIFLIVLLISATMFRFTRRLEEIYGSL